MKSAVQMYEEARTSLQPFEQFMREERRRQWRRLFSHLTRGIVKMPHDERD